MMWIRSLVKILKHKNIKTLKNGKAIYNISDESCKKNDL